MASCAILRSTNINPSDASLLFWVELVERDSTESALYIAIQDCSESLRECRLHQRASFLQLYNILTSMTAYSAPTSEVKALVYVNLLHFLVMEQFLVRLLF